VVPAVLCCLNYEAGMIEERGFAELAAPRDCGWRFIPVAIIDDRWLPRLARGNAAPESGCQKRPDVQREAERAGAES